MSQFFNSFINVPYSTRAGKGINPLTIGLSKVNDWHAYQFFVTENTTINGFIYGISSFTGTGASLSVSVGISTSLGTNGIFPYTIGNQLITTNAATAKTIAFEYEQSLNLNTTLTTGLDTIYTTTSASEYTLQAFTSYWVGMKVTSVGTAGTVNLYDMCNASSVTDNFLSNNVTSCAYQYRTGIAVTHEQEYILAIPIYSNSATGKTEYFQKYPVLLDNSTAIRYDTYREFGYKFELNDFPVQDLDVQGFKFSFIRTNALDSQFTMRLYGDDFTTVLGTSQVVIGYDWNNTNNSNEIEFVFDPVIKLRPNETYFAGISWTHPTTQPTVNATFIMNYKQNLIHTNQSAIGVGRTDVGSGALTDLGTNMPILNFLISSTYGSNRAIGN